MEDNAIKPNTVSPASGPFVDTMAGVTSVPVESTPPDRRKNFLEHFRLGRKQDPLPQPATQQTSAEDTSDFSDRLGIAGQPIAAIDTNSPSMDGPNFVTGPNPPVPGTSSIVPPDLSGQLPQESQTASNGEGVSPDMSSGLEDTARIAVLKARESLEDVAKKVQAALENIDVALGTKPADVPADMQPTPQEPVGVGS